jgi:HK97 family phage major capsid protein
MSVQSGDQVAQIETKLAEIAKSVSLVSDLSEKVRSLDNELKKTVTEARSLAETARANQDSIDNALREIGDKYTNLEKTLGDLQKAQRDLAVAFGRPAVGGGHAEEELKVRRDAAILHKSILTRSQRLDFTNIRMPDSFVDVAKAYNDAFHFAIRFDWKSQMSREVEKALSIGSDPAAGYLVPTEMSSQILRIIYESTPIAEMATTINITGPALSFPVDDAEADAGWVGETQARPPTSEPTVGEQSVSVHELYANVYASQVLLEDAGMDIESWLAQKVGEKFARKEATAFITGDGVKKPRGLLSYPHGTTRGYIEQIPTGSATTVTADAIVKMPFMLKSAYTANATWLMSRHTLAQIALLKDANNQYLWRMGLENGRPSMLVGYPVRTGEDMPQIAAGALVYAFGDFRRAYTIVRRLGVSMLRDPYTGTPFVRFYFRQRVGGDVVNFEAVKLGKIAT